MRYLGIDVAKAKLDCVLLDPDTSKRKTKSVGNNAEGIAALLKSLHDWGVAPSEIHVLMEPTSCYHEAAALALGEAGCTVSLVNPVHHAQALGARSKTDAADAALLARYGAAERPAAWVSPSASVRALRALLARRDALAADLRRERNRAEKAEAVELPESVRQSQRETIDFLGKQLETLQREIARHIDNDPDLKGKRELLLSIPGVGERVAQHMRPCSPRATSIAPSSWPPTWGSYRSSGSPAPPSKAGRTSPRPARRTCASCSTCPRWWPPAAIRISRRSTCGCSNAARARWPPWAPPCENWPICALASSIPARPIAQPSSQKWLDL